MWINVILLTSVYPALATGRDSITIDMSVDYFAHRDVKLVCLLTCENDFWIHRFAKQAMNQMISASVVRDDIYSSTRIEQCLQQSFSSIGVLVDASCPKFNETMYYVSLNSLLDSAHKWLILGETSLEPYNNNSKICDEENEAAKVFGILGELNISVDADILLAERRGENNYKLLELFNFGKIQGGKLLATKSGTWSMNTSFSDNLNVYKYYRRYDFQQWSMRMISVVSPAPEKFDPKILTDRKPVPGVATITKTSTTILEVISDVHNLRFVHSIADRWIGDYSFNNSKTVVASSLYYKQQDISSLIRFIKEVFEKVEMVHPPLTAIQTRYYYRIPTYGAGKFENQFLRPLSTGAWISVMAVIALCAVVLVLSAKLEKRPSSGQYAVFSVMASICQQFFEDNTVNTRRESAARRFTILVTGVSCVLIYNYYTSSVVSWLLSGPPPSINSLQELLVSPLELIYEDVGYTRSWLQTPTYYFNKRNAEIEDEMRKKKVFNKKKDEPLLMTVEEGIRMVKAGGFAYHTEVDNANREISRTFTQSELCELGSLQSIEKTLLYPCVQKNSPYKEFLVWSLARLLERGIVKCIQLRMASPPVGCEGSSPRALTLGGAAPAFLLLVAGYLLATMIMLMERAIWQQKGQRKGFRKKKLMTLLQPILEKKEDS